MGRERLLAAAALSMPDLAAKLNSFHTVRFTAFSRYPHAQSDPLITTRLLESSTWSERFALWYTGSSPTRQFHDREMF
ncbi:MAG: hypothetical protein JO202_16600 [Ktedonobacteraceae bacterium]|nr:hypothetical protein [Ktedonobacteraceae bacterium]